MQIDEIGANAPDVISRSDAKNLGLEFYFSGKPCLYNQISQRRVSTGHCQCFICIAKQKHKESLYQKNNPQKRREKVNRCAKKKRIKKSNPVFIKPLY